MRHTIFNIPRVWMTVACLLACLPVAANEEPARAYPVRGVVLDEKGEALPWATVRVRGTNIGAGTNAAGEFTLLLREGGDHVIVASFVGFEPR